MGAGAEWPSAPMWDKQARGKRKCKPARQVMLVGWEQMRMTMRTILVLGFLAAFLLVMLPVHLILWLVGHVMPQLRYRIGKHVADRVFEGILFLAQAKVEVKGQENIPEEPVLFVSNHRSIADIPVIFTTCGKRPGFAAKQEMRRMYLLSGWMDNIGCLFLDRKDLRSGMEMVKNGAKQIRKGNSLVIFPEGHRSQGEMLPFKEGSLKIAEKAVCPVVPVTLIGTDQIAGGSAGFFIRKGRVKVIYGEPIMLADLPKEERRRAGAAIRSEIEETIRREQD